MTRETPRSLRRNLTVARVLPIEGFPPVIALRLDSAINNSSS